MNLLIKPEWRGVFQMYLVDFKRKERSLTYYPTLFVILQKNSLFSMGSFFYKNQSLDFKDLTCCACFQNIVRNG